MTKTNLPQRYLLTGSSGLIGSFFINDFILKRKKAIVRSPKHKEMDLLKPVQIQKLIEDFNPEVIINFAAFRNATEAEKQRGDKNGSVWKTNVVGVKNITKVCQRYQIPLIHISSDYVFAGTYKKPGPYSEQSTPEGQDDILSWYGITKRESERIIQENLKKFSIIRICNVSRPNNSPLLDYIGKIYHLYQAKKLYPVFYDQFITLTYIPSITEVIYKIIKSQAKGIFHVSSTNICTPFELANYIIRKDKSNKHTIQSVSIDSFLKTSPRRYPKYGGLKSDKTQQKLKLQFHTWQEIVDKYFHR